MTIAVPSVVFASGVVGQWTTWPTGVTNVQSAVQLWNEPARLYRTLAMTQSKPVSHPRSKELFIVSIDRQSIAITEMIGVHSL